MSCDQYRDALADVAAGGRAETGFESHLERCEACRGELDARRAALALADAELAGLLASDPSSELPSRIRRAVAAQPARRSWPGRPALAAAAAVVIALGATVTWQATSRAPRPEAPRQTRLAAPPPKAVPRDHRPAPVPGAPAAKSVDAEVPTAREPFASSPGPAEPSPPESPAAPSVRPFVAEILVPAGQEDALVRFAADLQARTVASDSLLVAEPSAPLNPPRPLHRVEIEMLQLDSSIGSGL